MIFERGLSLKESISLGSASTPCKAEGLLILAGDTQQLKTLRFFCPDLNRTANSPSAQVPEDVSTKREKTSHRKRIHTVSREWNGSGNLA
jgi:hypothetical protein